MKGYYRSPDATVEAFREGWFHTGDVGYLDECGNLFLVDRKKDVILRGGYTVYPAEVEAVLVEHPWVSECAVVGMAHEILGEEVVAFVVPAKGLTLAESDLVAWARERMAGYKYPRRIWCRPELPRGTKGQVLKQVLREQLYLGTKHAEQRIQNGEG
jgi:long-chain acyl-CoA synthetase